MQFKSISYVLLCFSLLLSIHARAGDLAVEVSGMHNNSGKVYLILCHNAECFDNLGDDDAVLYAISARKIEDKTVSFSFPQLPKGDYALFAFHDANSNEDIDTTMLGWPKEAFGFSNQLPVEASPKFRQAKFAVADSGVTTQTIKVAYLAN